MFNIEWLNGMTPVEREASALSDIQRVVDYALTRSAFVRRRHPGAEPTGFQIVDTISGFAAVYPVDGGKGRAMACR
jgi:hypothetical protein